MINTLLISKMSRKLINTISSYYAYRINEHDDRLFQPPTFIDLNFRDQLLMEYVAGLGKSSWGFST